MLDLYAWPTPNAHKVSIMLEEIGLPYNVVAVDIRAGEQFAPDFLRISPNNRMPAIVDHDAPGGAISIFESGAILMYLAEKSGQFWPTEVHKRYEVAQWVMWQMGGLGPMLGQANHFRHVAPEQLPYAVDRYASEAKRLFGVLDSRLQDREYIAGEYSIADMACYSWTTIFEHLGIPIEDYPAIQRWQARMAERPAVERGMALLAEKRSAAAQPMDAKTRENLFGKAQHERRK
jgi:GST-like protein